MNKWIKIEEKMPRDYEDVLLYIPSHGKAWFHYGAMCVGSYSRVRKCFCMESTSIRALYNIDKPLDLVTSAEAREFMCNFEPSHWQKLPERPTADYETLGWKITGFFKAIYYLTKFYWRKIKEIF